jgi:MerR family transcriptional regulator/heat shock protein HspR
MSVEEGQQTYCSVEVAAHLVRLSPARVRRCLRAGLLRPATMKRGAPLFGEAELARLRKIRRLIEDLGVNLAGVEIILRLVDELAALRAETARARRV